jgi:hypothetical protein
MLKLEKFNVRIIGKGDRHGRNDCLTHDDDRPIVEFYDHRYTHDDWPSRGQFISSYYVGTLLGYEGFYGGEPVGGLCLDGGNPNEWSVSADEMALVRAYLKAQEQTA